MLAEAMSRKNSTSTPSDHAQTDPGSTVGSKLDIRAQIDDVTPVENSFYCTPPSTESVGKEQAPSFSTPVFEKLPQTFGKAKSKRKAGSLPSTDASTISEPASGSADALDSWEQSQPPPLGRTTTWDRAPLSGPTPPVTPAGNQGCSLGERTATWDQAPLQGRTASEVADDAQKLEEAKALEARRQAARERRKQRL